MRSVVVAFVLLIGVSANTSFACENWVAKVVSTNGLVEIKEGSQSKSAEIDSVVCPGQIISVAANSRAALYLSNNSFVRLDQNTVLAFPKAPSDQGFWVQLQRGVSHFISRITQRFVVDAPYVNAAVDGTEFLVSAQGKESSVSVIEGQVTASNEGGQQVLTMGQKAVATGKASGFRLTPIQTEDVIDWAIYYSPLPVLQELQASDSDPVYQELIEQTQQQRPDLALQALQKRTLTESLRVADAALLMSVGQAEKALAQIESSTFTQALALKSVIFSSRNQSEKALDYAQKAVQQDSQSSAALLALSYAHQAALNLPEALQAAHQATLLEENNAIAWARVSEMELAMGNIRQADKAIAHAQQKQPDSAYVITQAGFIKLFNIRIDSAKALFKQAIALDSENPQAHLGLGLALLRQGELKQGREQLEYATSLDPARSVVRSYLGRAYFEEKRDEEAGTQWALAKQLDPNDPTPYFYEGVRKLYANDPIGAIEELETSRKLNDERALYRSETLLQSDAASRSATLARAYDDVGYDQGVLLSGWDALKNDPTSSEGHRLLADYYRGNSRYETARASELLQSQLWQPLSAYPLQPQLSETGISVVEGSGPQNPGFNEYHSLFTQDGVYGSVTGYGGSDGTWGDDLVGSFLAGPVAVSLGQYHFETDGWRSSAYQTQDGKNLFAQWEMMSGTDIQIEYRKFDWDRGNLEPDWLVSTEDVGSIVEDRENKRVGLKQRINSSNTMIVSVVQQEISQNSLFQAVSGESSNAFLADVDTYEIQNVSRLGKSSLVAGFGYSDVNRDVSALVEREIGDLIPQVYDISVGLTSTDESEYKYGYAYYTGEWDAGLVVMLGASYDLVQVNFASQTVEMLPAFVPLPPFFFEHQTDITYSDASFNENVFSPKLAVSYTLDSLYIASAALFRSYSKAVEVGHTIEPTTLFGVSQVHSDPAFSVVDNASLSINRSGSVMSYGVSWLKRVGDFRLFHNGGFPDASFSDIVFEVFNNLRVGSALALDFRLLVESREYDGLPVESINVVEKSSVYKAPLTFSFFKKDGWSLELEQAYYSHDITYISPTQDKEKENSWVTSIEIEKCVNLMFLCFSGGVENVLDSSKEVSNFDNTLIAFYPGRLVYFNIQLNI